MTGTWDWPQAQVYEYMRGGGLRIYLKWKSDPDLGGNQYAIASMIGMRGMMSMYVDSMPAHTTAACGEILLKNTVSQDFPLFQSEPENWPTDPKSLYFWSVEENLNYLVQCEQVLNLCNLFYIYSETLRLRIFK